MEYKIVALKSTGKILRALDFDFFQDLYEMLLPFIRKAMDDALKDGSSSTENIETISLDLQQASVECLGEAWPENPGTQSKYVVELLSVLNAMVLNTTRKIQFVIATAVGQIVASYNLNPTNDDKVIDSLASTLSYLLSMPKNSQLRAEALNVLDQTIDVVEKSSPNSSSMENFQSQIGKSLDDVIKDLATDAAIKDKARKTKLRLHSLHKMDCE